MTVAVRKLHSHQFLNKPLLTEEQFQFVKKFTTNSIKKERENPFNTVYEKWRKLVYVDHPYAFNSMGYEEDISRIKYKDVLYEYEDFESRDKYLISNNINIKSQEKIIEDKNNKEYLNCFSPYFTQENRFVDTYQKCNQTKLLMGNQTCSQFCKEYLKLKLLDQKFFLLNYKMVCH